jgi:hypothetical protein
VSLADMCNLLGIETKRLDRGRSDFTARLRASNPTSTGPFRVSFRECEAPVMTTVPAAPRKHSRRSYHVFFIAA